MDLKKGVDICFAGRGILLVILLLFLITGTGCEREAETLSFETTDSLETEYTQEGAEEREVQSETVQKEEKAIGEFSEETSFVTEEPEPSPIYVDVAGAVKKPGVYTLGSGDRVFQAIEAAGGFTSDACIVGINQARELADGEQLRILTIEEVQRLQESGKTEEIEKAQIQESTVFQDGAAQQTQALVSDKVNLNTADENTLMTLPGIGESKARAIIAYRDMQGGFQSIEEIMEVEGIKEGVFLKIKEQIVVG